MQHRRRDDTEDQGEFPMVWCDFCFPGQLDAPVRMPVWVMRENGHGCTRAYGLATKSVSDGRNAGLIRQVVEDLKDSGFTKVVWKADNEEVLTSLRDQVKAASDVQIVPQNPVARQSASNGFVECAVREVEGALRTVFVLL